MRALRDMATIQIELTNACVLRCANCTRLCGHAPKPYFVEESKFRQAIDSLVDFPHQVGIMGGEPLLHPQFEELCDYAVSKIPRERLGLWTVLPNGKEHHREVICRTFGSISLNDHSRTDIMHAPLLVSSEEVIKDRANLFMVADKCWVQNSWSASINPKGAWFCEVAGALAELLDGPGGWPVEPGWWKRTPKDFKEQIEEYCPKCGGCLPLARRSSQDLRDDISPGMLERLKGRSRKIERGEYIVSEFKMDPELAKNPYPDQTYKDMRLRNRMAARYGIFLILNEQQYLEPNLRLGFDPSIQKEPIFEQFARIV